MSTQNIVIELPNFSMFIVECDKVQMQLSLCICTLHNIPKMNVGALG